MELNTTQNHLPWRLALGNRDDLGPAVTGPLLPHLLRDLLYSQPVYTHA